MQRDHGHVFLGARDSPSACVCGPACVWPRGACTRGPHTLCLLRVGCVRLRVAVDIRARFPSDLFFPFPLTTFQIS